MHGQEEKIIFGPGRGRMGGGVYLLYKALVALVALVRLDPRVDALVVPQCVDVAEGLLANLA